MTHTVVAVANADNPMTPALLDDIKRQITGVDVGDVVALRDGVAYDIGVRGAFDVSPLREFANARGVDVALVPSDNRKKKILVSDMDATALNMETLDYMAQLLGIGEKTRDITDRAMAGEIDFIESLTERIGVMAGMDAGVMDTLLDNLDYTVGAKVAVQTLVRDGADCALVSGGFTFTTAVVARELGFQQHHANNLDVADGVFTGTLSGDLISPDTKAEILQAMMQKHGVGVGDTATIGDGANDIPMLKMAGMGVAFYGKPLVRQATDVQINVTDYSTLLYYMGYAWDMFFWGE